MAGGPAPSDGSAPPTLTGGSPPPAPTIDLAALEASAANHLDPRAAAYFRGAAGDSALSNVAAWEAYRLQPRVLRDVSQITTDVQLLHTRASSPILIAPTAMHRLACPDGELATARAAAKAGVVYVVSAAASTSIEDITTAAPTGTRWMQAYVMQDRGITRAMLERAAEAGCEAIVVTVDAPGIPHPTKPAGHPVNHGRPLNDGHPLPNLLPDEEGPDVLEVASRYATDLTFEELADIKAWTGLPLVVKGVLQGADAARCVAAGADAIVVSNHGGRQVPGCVATANALPGVVEAVGGRADVYVDGGIRSGADVVRALALGAHAVMVGRPVVWGLGIGGEAGAHAVLSALQAELVRTLALCGVGDVRQVSADLVRWAGA